MSKNTKTFFVRNAIQAALFNQVLINEITKPEGRWFGVRTKGHAEAFTGAVAKVAKGDQTVGLDFAAPKRNYNFNDSNWTNQEPVLARLTEVSKSANGNKDIAKKAIVSELEDMKNIMKASSQPEPAPAATTEAPQVQEA